MGNTDSQPLGAVASLESTLSRLEEALVSMEAAHQDAQGHYFPSRATSSTGGTTTTSGDCSSSSAALSVHEDDVYRYGAHLRVNPAVSILVGPVIGEVTPSSVVIMLEVAVADRGDTLRSSNFNFNASLNGSLRRFPPCAAVECFVSVVDCNCPRGRVVTSRMKMFKSRRPGVFRIGTGLRPGRRYTVCFGGLRKEDSAVRVGSFTTPEALHQQPLHLVAVSADRPHALLPGEVSLWAGLSERISRGARSKVKGMDGKDNVCNSSRGNSRPAPGKRTGDEDDDETAIADTTSPVDMVLHIGGQVWMEDAFEEAWALLAETHMDRQLSAMGGGQGWRDAIEAATDRMREVYRRTFNMPHKRAVLAHCSNVMLGGQMDIHTGFNTALTLIAAQQQPLEKSGGAGFTGSGNKAPKGKGEVLATCLRLCRRVYREYQGQLTWKLKLKSKTKGWPIGNFVYEDDDDDLVIEKEGKRRGSGAKKEEGEAAEDDDDDDDIDDEDDEEEELLMAWMKELEDAQRVKMLKERKVMIAQVALLQLQAAGELQEESVGCAEAVKQIERMKKEVGQAESTLALLAARPPPPSAARRSESGVMWMGPHNLLVVVDTLWSRLEWDGRIKEAGRGGAEGSNGGESGGSSRGWRRGGLDSEVIKVLQEQLLRDSDLRLLILVCQEPIVPIIYEDAEEMKRRKDLLMEGTGRAKVSEKADLKRKDDDDDGVDKHGGGGSGGPNKEHSRADGQSQENNAAAAENSSGGDVSLVDNADGIIKIGGLSAPLPVKTPPPRPPSAPPPPPPAPPVLSNEERCRLLDIVFAWKQGEPWREVVVLCGAGSDNDDGDDTGASRGGGDGSGGNRLLAKGGYEVHVRSPQYKEAGLIRLVSPGAMSCRPSNFNFNINFAQTTSSFKFKGGTLTHTFTGLPPANLASAIPNKLQEPKTVSIEYFMKESDAGLANGYGSAGSAYGYGRLPHPSRPPYLPVTYPFSPSLLKTRGTYLEALCHPGVSPAQMIAEGDPTIAIHPRGIRPHITALLVSESFRPVRCVIGPVIGRVTQRTVVVLVEIDATGTGGGGGEGGVSAASAAVGCVVADSVSGKVHRLVRRLTGGRPYAFYFNTLQPHRHYSVFLEGVINSEERTGSFTSLPAWANRRLPPALKIAHAEGKSSRLKSGIKVEALDFDMRIMFLDGLALRANSQHNIGTSTSTSTLTAASTTYPGSPSLCETVGQTLWEPWGQTDVVVHTGGQVDLSLAVRAAAACLVMAEGSTSRTDKRRWEDEAMERIRAAYRHQWSLPICRTILSRCSHVMLRGRADDDIEAHLHADMENSRMASSGNSDDAIGGGGGGGGVSFPSLSSCTSSTSASSLTLSPYSKMTLNGMISRAFREYQRQLWDPEAVPTGVDMSDLAYLPGGRTIDSQPPTSASAASCGGGGDGSEAGLPSAAAEGEWHFHLWGETLGLFCLDVDSECGEQGCLLSPRQWQSLRTVLSLPSLQCLYLVSSVPFMVDSILDALHKARQLRHLSQDAVRSWSFHGGELLRLVRGLMSWKVAGTVDSEPREVMMIAGGGALSGHASGGNQLLSNAVTGPLTNGLGCPLKTLITDLESRHSVRQWVVGPSWGSTDAAQLFGVHKSGMLDDRLTYTHCLPAVSDKTKHVGAKEATREPQNGLGGGGGGGDGGIVGGSGGVGDTSAPPPPPPRAAVNKARKSEIHGGTNRLLNREGETRVANRWDEEPPPPKASNILMLRCVAKGTGAEGSLFVGGAFFTSEQWRRLCSNRTALAVNGANCDYNDHGGGGGDGGGGGAAAADGDGGSDGGVGALVGIAKDLFQKPKEKPAWFADVIGSVIGSISSRGGGGGSQMTGNLLPESLRDVQSKLKETLLGYVSAEICGMAYESVLAVMIMTSQTTTMNLPSDSRADNSRFIYTASMKGDVWVLTSGIHAELLRLYLQECHRRVRVMVQLPPSPVVVEALVMRTLTKPEAGTVNGGHSQLLPRHSLALPFSDVSSFTAFFIESLVATHLLASVAGREG